MSKNTGRYKEDYAHLTDDTLEEIDTTKFEKFHPKKEDSKNKSQVKQKKKTQAKE